MQNARKYDTRITVGVVPGREDLNQLVALSYKTLVDVRDDEERFGGTVARMAEELGLRYISIPVRRDAIALADLVKFYETVFAPSSAPLYVFSRAGKKPLAFLLVLEAAARQEPIGTIFRRASEFGMSLEGDQALQAFIVRLMNSGELGPVLESLREQRPELFVRGPEAAPSAATPVAPPPPDAIQSALCEATRHWAATRHVPSLRRMVAALLAQLDQAEGR